MSGSLTQMAGVGAQSATISGGDYSPFKTVVRKVVPFAAEARQIEFNGTPDYGKQVTASIQRAADLLSKCWLVLEIGGSGTTGTNTVPDGTAASTHTSGQSVTIGGTEVKAVEHMVEDFGRAILESVTFEAGSIKYQEIFPEFLHLYESLTTPTEKLHHELTGRGQQAGHIHSSAGTTGNLIEQTYSKNRFYVPLPFFFSKSYGHALPIVALHLTDLVIKIKFKKKSELVSKVVSFAGNARSAATPPATGFQSLATSTNAMRLENAYILGEYIWLSDVERARFAQSAHAYLIEQVQQQIDSVASNVKSHSARLNFNHPCKFFAWFGRHTDTDQSANNEWLDWRNQGEDGLDFGANGDLFETASISLNNNQRITPLGPKYFRILQPKEHWTCIPQEFIYVYNFALNPQGINPSGHLNCSRIETITLDLKFRQNLVKPLDLHVYTVNYNVVRISSGISSIAWSS